MSGSNIVEGHAATTARPVILVSSDVRTADGYNWHGAPHTYLDALVHGIGALPLIVPAYGDALDISALLDHADGVLITGSRSNVHPGLYGEAPSPAHEPYDPARDATTLPLIRAALTHGVPLLCICRGLQELNVASGGTLDTEIQEQEGRMDHRAPASDIQAERFAIRHDVNLTEGGRLSALADTPAIRVSSVHRQAIGTLSAALDVEAYAPDGTIEAVRPRDATAFALAVQWHPEYWFREDAMSARIFEAFGDAAQERATKRAKGNAA